MKQEISVALLPALAFHFTGVATGKLCAKLGLSSVKTRDHYWLWLSVLATDLKLQTNCNFTDTKNEGHNSFIGLIGSQLSEICEERHSGGCMTMQWKKINNLNIAL